MSKGKHADYYVLDGYLNNNTEAGKKLLSDCYIPVRQYVFKHTNALSFLSDDDRLGIVNESFARAMKRIPVYRGDSSFCTFVIAVAKYVILETNRKANHPSENTTALDILEESPSIELGDITRNPLVQVIEKEEREEVYRALGALSNEHQQIIRLRLINGCSYKKISEFTGKSISASESMFARALKAFCNEFKKK